ncbi:MAG: type II toxin-antitoxin system prevent-host-death family antitoxin [Betaproteobacteria bacterium]|nr:type II toxin-antitoxin system prevent-host-death family antitoxin [Betaproteobacteria bacterium]
MATIGVFEAKARLSELIDQASSGKKIIITRHGLPVAELVPVGSGALRSRGQVMEHILELRAKCRTGKVDLRALIEEGRP